MNTAWCPVCGNAIMNTEVEPMQCAGPVTHYSAYNVYGVPQQVSIPDAPVPAEQTEEKQETQQAKSEKTKAK